MMFIATDRNSKNSDTKFDFYDNQFNHLPFTQGHKNSEKVLDKPINFEKMVFLAEKLSKDFIHVRVDFYETNGEVFFGEITFFHFSGLEPIVPKKWDRIIGSWLKLPIANN